MSDPKHPRPGDQVVDLSDLALKDITPEQAQKLTKPRDGIAKAVTNVLLSDSEARKRAGVSDDEVVELTALWADYQRLEEVLPAVEKLAELVKETRQLSGHEIAIRVGEIANQIRRRGERSINEGEVVAPFSVLLDYQFGPAVKAAATREKAKGKTDAPAQSPAVTR